MSYEDKIALLREPFNSKEIEWKVQVTSQDKTKGMAIAYLTGRAVQRRLDETVGPFNWKNVYSLWHDKSQICGISIFNPDRNEWVTKFDGAENSDIEPIKGGLSDSFKRAASVWGVGRYLYELDGIWVEIEQRGKSYAIKANQFAKLEKSYNDAIAMLSGSIPISLGASATNITSISSITPPSETHQAPDTSSSHQKRFVKQIPDASKTQSSEYKVNTIKPSGKSSQIVELINDDGDVIKAYIKSGDASVVEGSILRDVIIVKKTSEHGDYNLITSYQTAA